MHTDTGDDVSLKDFRGKNVVLYFYPKDDTSGCTSRPANFATLMPRFTKGSAVILGVSPDNVKSHQKFKAKYDLPFTLLADTEHAIAREVRRVEGEEHVRPQVHGRRADHLPDRCEGHSSQVFEKVKPAGHADEVAAAWPTSEVRPSGWRTGAVTAGAIRV